MLPTNAADAIFWIAAVSCLIAQGAILRSVLAARTGRGAADAPRARQSVEIAWAVVPAVALALVLAATWRTLHPTPVAPAPAAPVGASA